MIKLILIFLALVLFFQQCEYTEYYKNDLINYSLNNITQNSNEIHSKLAKICIYNNINGKDICAIICTYENESCPEKINNECIMKNSKNIISCDIYTKEIK